MHAVRLLWGCKETPDVTRTTRVWKGEIWGFELRLATYLLLVCTFMCAMAVLKGIYPPGKLFISCVSDGRNVQSV